MSATTTPQTPDLDRVNAIVNPQLQQWKQRTTDTPGIWSGAFVQETLAMTRRLFIQLQRRPSTLVAGVIQPLIWLVLFGALFQNVPSGLFGESQNYGQFLGAGIIVFTAFGGALNAGLPVMFDREFGFLNRFLVAPLASRYSIVVASALFIAAMSLVQTAAIIGLSAVLGAGLPGLTGLALVVGIVLTLVLGVTALSLGLAFALPGHIELIAVIFVTNLPLLFASTALVPLSFMPGWLQVVASLNPLSYAIEPIRHIYVHGNWTLGSVVMAAPFADISLGACLGVLVGFSALALALIQPLLRRRLV
ncbi:putative doxorubicin resistance ABC transporter permease protein DrrC [Halomicronema hongdechloris C2206]|uniref:Transport permease protein n=1 Tax=Halomicronema hongdechloris C2206 TaxID=1641165 RepID=A0A1Z3HK64_9CYAN|nr:ABC transporter permease [Halomicronema hongdechloris]ASC70675.1 putative doxorubicin resistance ABC transporter permease protein DrrC [Halomicronema hongdechloris C2206]